MEGPIRKLQLRQVGQLQIGMNAEEAEKAISAMRGTCTYSGIFSKVLSGAEFGDKNIFDTLTLKLLDGRVEEIDVIYWVGVPNNQVKAVLEKHIEHHGAPLEIGDIEDSAVKTVDDVSRAGGYLLWDDGDAVVRLSHIKGVILTKKIKKSSGFHRLSDEQF